VLYRALLRLPREMSLEAKKFRTLETINELGIKGIEDSRIGDSGRCIGAGRRGGLVLLVSLLRARPSCFWMSLRVVSVISFVC
jgi:hypothetical protein